MGIQINGATDSITAIDGTIDVVSAIGNAGVVTATAFVGNITGNVTGNINHASNLELQVGGVTRANINSSGQLTATGKVFTENNLGIRNTSASVPLHVKAPDTGGGNIAYFDDTGSGTTARLMVLTTDGVASGGIKFQTVNKRYTYFGNATNKITIDNNNSKIGINTDAPSKELHVDGTIFASGNTASLNGGLRIQPNNDGTNYGGVIYGGAHNDNNTAIFMRRGQDGTLNTIDINSYATFRVFTTGALASQSERFRIDQYGNAGLGVVPRTAAGGINNDTNVYLAIGDNDTGIAQDGDGQLELWANNQEIANFNAASVTLTKDLTIPDKIIHSGDTNTFIRFPDAGDIISMTVGNYEKLKIESGDITIPSSNLLLTSDSHRIKLGAASDFQLSHTGTVNRIQSYVGNIEYISPTGSGHSFQVNSQERLFIDSSGHLKHTGIRSGNSENKLAILSAPSYNTSEEDVIIYQAENEVSSNQLSIGGGTSSRNAVTAISLRTASAVNTTGGTERLRITGEGKMGLNHTTPPSQFVVRAPGGSGHCSSQVHSGDSSTIMNMQTVQATEGRFGMNTNHDLAIYTNGLEKARLSKTGSLFLKCLDTVPINQAESGHYSSTGYNAGHALGLMVKRSICVSDADTKGVGGIFLSHTRNVTCDGTTYNMMTLHNREGTFVGDVYVGFAVGGAGVVRHYKFTCLYSASTLTSIDNASRGGKSETISVNISSSNDAHFFQVIPNMSTNEAARVSMTIVGAACGRNDGAGGDYYTVNYN